MTCKTVLEQMRGNRDAFKPNNLLLYFYVSLSKVRLRSSMAAPYPNNVNRIAPYSVSQPPLLISASNLRLIKLGTP